MIIQTTRTFDKQFIKQSPKIQKQFKDRVSLFMIEPFDRKLRNHPLKGKYLGYRSIDITGDIRALFKVQADIIIFGFIGSHSELY